jgi:hypothetical protein
MLFETVLLDSIVLCPTVFVLEFLARRRAARRENKGVLSDPVELVLFQL